MKYQAGIKAKTIILRFTAGTTTLAKTHMLAVAVLPSSLSTVASLSSFTFNSNVCVTKCHVACVLASASASGQVKIAMNRTVALNVQSRYTTWNHQKVSAETWKGLSNSDSPQTLPGHNHFQINRISLRRPCCILRHIKHAGLLGQQHPSSRNINKRATQMR